MKKITAILLVLLMVTMLSACSGTDSGKVTPKPTQSKNAESSKDYVTFANLDTHFYSLKRGENGEWPACEFIAPVTRKKTVQLSNDSTVVSSESQFSYALCNGKEVSILVTPEKLVVGDQTKVFNATPSASGSDEGWEEDYPDIGIVDLNEHDQYKEILLTENLPNDFSEQMIYRFDGKRIIEIANFGSTEAAYIDHQGGIVEGGDYLDIVDPLVALSYYQLKGTALKEIVLDQSKMMGKQYVYGTSDQLDDRTVNFLETSTAPDLDYSSSGKDQEGMSADATYVSSLGENKSSQNTQHQFKQGETFTLLKMSRERMGNDGAWYYVQLQDGRRGVIYWFLAG